MNHLKVFESLPHIDKIWVTEDGNFHLHPNNGGSLILRPSDDISQDQTEEIKTSQPKGNKKQK